MQKSRYKYMQKHVKGTWVQCYAVENKDKVYLGLQDDDDTCICYYDSKIERKWGSNCKLGFYRANCCVIPNKNNSFLLVGWKGDIFAQNGLKQDKYNSNDMIPNLEKEEPIPLLSNCSLSSISVIDGQAYVVGAWRTVFRRDGVNSWTCLHGNDAKEVEKLQKSNRDIGFNDIDGFSKDEIYACGGDGDLWSYDGKKWKAIDAPTNKAISSICCASNGKVYIGCYDGTLIEGRGSNWKVLKENLNMEHDVYFLEDMIWYQDNLYIACGKYGLYIYDGKSISTVSGLTSMGSILGKEEMLSDGIDRALNAGGMSEEDINLTNVMSTMKMKNDDILLAPSILSTDGDILLVGDSNRVVAFNGKEWKMFFRTYPSDEGGKLW